MGLGRQELAVLDANMPRLKARKKFEEYIAGRSKLHHDEVFDTVLEATGSEALANAYRCTAIKAATWKPR